MKDTLINNMIKTIAEYGVLNITGDEDSSPVKALIKLGYKVANVPSASCGTLTILLKGE